MRDDRYELCLTQLRKLKQRVIGISRQGKDDCKGRLCFEPLCFELPNLLPYLYPSMPQEALFHDQMTKGMLHGHRAWLPKDLNWEALVGESSNDGWQPVEPGSL